MISRFVIINEATSRPSRSSISISTTAELSSSNLAQSRTDESTTVPTVVQTEINTNISQEIVEMAIPTTHQLPKFKTTQSDSDLIESVNEETTWTTLQEQIKPLLSNEFVNSTSSTRHFIVPNHTAFTILDNDVLTSDHQISGSILASLTTCATATIGFLAVLAFTLAVLIPLFNYVKKRRFRLR